MRLLLLEDDSDSREAMAELLSGEGFSVRSAATTEEAIAALHVESFSFVLADYVVGPKAQAEANAERLLAAAGLVPVGCMTGWRLPRALTGRFTFVLVKPFGLETLLSRIGQALPATIHEGQAAIARE